MWVASPLQALRLAAARLQAEQVQQDLPAVAQVLLRGRAGGCAVAGLQGLEDVAMEEP